jgi:hypothetical protein
MELSQEDCRDPPNAEISTFLQLPQNEIGISIYYEHEPDVHNSYRPVTIETPLYYYRYNLLSKNPVS